nr:uncharacterized protein LOC109785321 isoform X2 [Aegilops tauschii subsp. strangulata]
MQRAAALLCRFLEIPDELQRRLEKRRANHWQWNTICSFYPDELWWRSSTATHRQGTICALLSCFGGLTSSKPALSWRTRYLEVSSRCDLGTCPLRGS